MKIIRLITVFAFFIGLSNCITVEGPGRPVDQTIYVYGVDGKPLPNKEVKLSAQGGLIVDESAKTMITDASGKVNFKFNWITQHESGAWNWFIDATPNDKMWALNRGRDSFQRSPRVLISPDTIWMDSLVPFKIRFVSNERIKKLSFWFKCSNEYAVNNDSYTKDGFFTRDFKLYETMTFEPRILDTTIQLKVFKQASVEIHTQFTYSDKADPNQWNGISKIIDKKTPRDSVYVMKLYY